MFEEIIDGRFIALPNQIQEKFRDLNACHRTRLGREPPKPARGA
jgi:hypothetical protein